MTSRALRATVVTLPHRRRTTAGGQISQFGCGFANPFEAALNLIVGFVVLPERCDVHASNVRLNRLRVFDDIFQALGRFVRK
jgi:hypothetical protein